MREMSIRICRAHLELTADAAVEAHNAATAATITTTTTRSNDLNPPPPSQPRLPKPASNAVREHDSGREMPDRKKEAPTTSGSSSRSTVNIRSSSDVSSSSSSKRRCSRGGSTRSSSTSSSSSAVGAVVRAACLIAAQGMMDPAGGPRLAGESLARSALSLLSSAHAIVWGDEAADDDDKEEEVGAEPSLADTAEPHRKNGSARADSTREENDRRRRSSSRSAATSDSPTAADTAGGSQESSGTVVPLRDLRWGLELVLACVAPYLASGIELANENATDGRVPIVSGADGSAAGSVGNKSRRRSTSILTSISTSIDSRRKSDLAIEVDGGLATEPKKKGSGPTSRAFGAKRDGNGDEQTLDGNAAAEKEEKVTRMKQPNLGESGGDSDADGDAGPSRLALRIVDFACRHPDIGPALVSSILVGWIPLLVEVGCPTPPRPADTTTTGRLVRRPPGSLVGSTATVTTAAFATNPLSPSIPANANKITPSRTASIPRSTSTRCAAYTAGESAASEALVSGAIYMLIFMVKTFPLLPLSDFSAETLAGAAEGGMAFGGYTDFVGMDNGRRDGSGERGRRGSCGSSGVTATATALLSRDHHHNLRRRQRVSTRGRARQAGEALMLELFLCASGSGGSGGGGGRVGALDLGLGLGVDCLLGALHTARGINFLDETSSTSATAALAARRRLKKIARGCEGQGDGGTLAVGVDSTKRFGWENQNRVSSTMAPGKRWRYLRRSQRWRPVLTKVEVRQRLGLPPPQPQPQPTPTPTPSSTDRRLAATEVVGDQFPTNLPERAQDAGGALCHLARYDTSPGVYPDMSDSSDEDQEEGLSERKVSAKGDRAAGSGVRGDDHGRDRRRLSRRSVLDTSGGRRAEEEEDKEERKPATTTGTAGASQRQEGATAGSGLVAVVEGSSPQVLRVIAAADKQETTEGNTTKKTLFPLILSGGKSSSNAKELARKDDGVKKSVENTPETVVVEDKIVQTPGEQTQKKGGGGFMSKIFGRGKKKT